MRHPLYTIGHSTRSLDELVELLEEHGIRTLVDVRRFPGSRRHPHFGREPLAAALEGRAVAYRHEPALGGRRGAPAADSPNVAWRNASFRAYADHTSSDEFGEALERVLRGGEEAPLAVLCAEALPWRCHRRLIADVAVARGRRVVHILAPGRAEDHELHPDVRVDERGRVTWPAAPPEQRGLFEGGEGER